MTSDLKVGMLSAVFTGGDAGARLTAALREARAAGAELVVLPELPCQVWVPSSRTVRDDDAEPAAGPLHVLQASAAQAAGVAVLGGAIVRDTSGTRYNTALLFGADGELLHAYRKVHVPQEAGFYELDHYAGGSQPPTRCDAFALPLGVQICSDLNRPQGCNLLGASGAAAVLAPRATEASTFERWELVIRANAMTSCCYVLSVNRPHPERGVALGGPSIAVAPDGQVIARSEDRLVVIELELDAVRQARGRYPGYLAVPSALYARGWGAVPDRPPRG